MVKKGFGRIRYYHNSGARLYIPEKVISDSQFPFQDGEILKIELGNDSLILRVVEWHEMLNWETMPKVFEKLPPELKEKIEKPSGKIETQIE